MTNLLMKAAEKGALTPYRKSQYGSVKCCSVILHIC